MEVTQPSCLRRREKTEKVRSAVVVALDVVAWTIRRRRRAEAFDEPRERACASHATGSVAFAAPRRSRHAGIGFFAARGGKKCRRLGVGPAGRRRAAGG